MTYNQNYKTLVEIDKCVDEIIDVMNWIKYGKDTNDKKDLLWKLNKISNDISTSLFYEYYEFNHKIDSQLDTFVIPNKLYIYQTLNCDKRQSIIQYLENGLLHLRGVKYDINDPQEFEILYLENINELIEEHEDICALLNDFKKLKDNFIINCLTSNHPRNQDLGTEHMWNEYGRNDSAICIEIDMNNKRNTYIKEYMKKVEYVDNIINIKQLFNKIVSLDINEYRKKILKDLFVASLYTKLKRNTDSEGNIQNWEQENEYRIIIGYGDANFYNNKTIRYVPSKIYYRKQMPNEEKKVLRELSDEIHVAIEEVE